MVYLAICVFAGLATGIFIYLHNIKISACLHAQAFYQDFPFSMAQLGWGNGQLLACNAAFAQQLGYASIDDCLISNQFSLHLPDLKLKDEYLSAFKLDYLPFQLWVQRLRPCTGNSELVDIVITYIKQGQYINLLLKKRPKSIAYVPQASPPLNEVGKVSSYEEQELGPNEGWRLLKKVHQGQFIHWELDSNTGNFKHLESYLQPLDLNSIASGMSLSAWLAIIHPEDKREVEIAFRSLIKGELEDLDCRYRISTEAGIQVLARSFGRVIRSLVKGQAIKISGMHLLSKTVKSTSYLQDENAMSQLTNQFKLIKEYTRLIKEKADPASFLNSLGKIDAALDSIDHLFEQLNANDNVQKQMTTLCESLNVDFTWLVDSNALISISPITMMPVLNDLIQTQLTAGIAHKNMHLVAEYGNDFQDYCSSCGARISGLNLCLRLEIKGLSYPRHHLSRIIKVGFNTLALQYDENPIVIDSVKDSAKDRDKLIHNAQGHLSLSSDKAAAQVVLYFPSPPIKQKLSNRQDEFVSKASQRLLVIDDQAVILRYLRGVLSSAGYSTTTMSDALEAMRVFIADPFEFDLVITDQTMPGLSGDSVVQQMLNIRPSLPIIICSGYGAEPKDRELKDRELKDNKGKELNKHGATAYITKPIDVEQLLALVDESLSRHPEDKVGDIH